MKLTGRSLHYAFQVADRAATVSFYKNILGMKVLRHEEFPGTESNGKWSKTLMGYGPENDYFVIEFKYNYGIKSYKRGNSFLGVVIESSEVIKKVKDRNVPFQKNGNSILIRAPEGYEYIIIDTPQPQQSDPVKKIILASSDLPNTIEYWNKLLGLEIVQQTSNSVVFSYGSQQASFEFQDIKNSVDHSEAIGRIAISILTDELAYLQSKVDEANQKIITRLISLNTPGKAVVSILILADKDGHEIVFVGDEGFRELSQVDPNAEKELDKFMSEEQKLL